MSRKDPTLLARARQLRTEMTPAEARLWYHLRAKRLNGVKFVRQSVRRRYIADFVARSRKLIIEVDGDSHATLTEYDEHRSELLARQGYSILRFTNAEVMTNEPAVLETIVAALMTAPLPDPLPASGEREIGLP